MVTMEKIGIKVCLEKSIIIPQTGVKIGITTVREIKCLSPRQIILGSME